MLLIIKANEMHYFSNLFWQKTLHVSDISTVHHQKYLNIRIETPDDGH